MFPSQWMQTWMPYPYQFPGNVAWALHWWSLDAPYDPFADFTLLALHHAIVAWHQTIFVGLLHNTGSPQAVNVNIYIQGSAGLYTGASATPLVTWTVGNTLPLSHGVVVRRYTGVPGPRGRGRLFVPAVPFHDAVGNVLTNARMAAWQAACAHMTDPIIHAGVTFRPCLVSMASGTLTPITQLMVTPRLGLVHRRARLRRVWPNTPKPPPP